MPMIFLAALAYLAGGAALDSNWPQFRGPTADGRAPDQTVCPIQWGTGQNVAWKVPIPGFAWSSPVVASGKIFLTTAVTAKQKKPGQNWGESAGSGFSDMLVRRKPPEETYRFEVHCLDLATGKTLWRQLAIERKPTIPTHPSNSYATETPATDGERVYAYFAMIGLFAYDLEGRLLWKKDFGAYPMGFGLGTGSSPALHDGRLYIQCDNDSKPFLVALDAKTGEEIWRVERPSKTSWSTPFVWRNSLRAELVCAGSNRITSYDPATGKVLWDLGGVMGPFSASPAADSTQIYVGNNAPMSNGPLYAIRAGAAGDITLKKGETSNQFVAWFRTRSGPGLASPLLEQGRLYIPGQGILECLDAKTGERIFKERLPGARQFVSSPWLAAGKCFFLDEDGKTFVVEPGPKLNVVSQSQLPGEIFWSTPALAEGSLLIRGTDHLYCIRR